MTNYKYSNEDFVLKRKYFLTNECFELKKLKSENNNFIFINTELPCLISINKETPVVTNFNIKECSNIKNIQTLNNLYAFVFREKIILGNLNNSQSQNIVTKNINKQIYNLVNLVKINSIAYIEEELKDDLHLLNRKDYAVSEKENSYSQCALVIVDKNLNECIRFELERKNEVCYSFAHLDLEKEFYSNNYSNYFALGTAILEDNFKEPENGYIIILELTEKFKFKKICEIETRGGVYKIAAIKSIIYVSIASCFYIYKLSSENQTNANVLEFSNRDTKENYSNLDFWNLKLLKKSNEFNFIYDFICYDEFILISDMYRSVVLFKYNEEKDKLQELTRDYNPIWCNALVNIDRHIYMISDINNNIYNLKYELFPHTDEEKYK